MISIIFDNLTINAPKQRFEFRYPDVKTFKNDINYSCAKCHIISAVVDKVKVDVSEFKTVGDFANSI